MKKSRMTGFGAVGTRLAALLCVFPLMALAVVPARRPLPANLGMMVYDDSEFEFRPDVVPTPAAAEAYVIDKVNTLAGTSVGTYARNVGFGSDLTYYFDPATAVPGNRHHFGWRTLSEAAIQTTPDPCYTRRVATQLADGKRLMVDPPTAAERFDPVRVAGLRAKQLGLYYILTWRLNDPHNSTAGENNINIGEFRATGFSSTMDAPLPPGAVGAGAGDDAPRLINRAKAWDYYYDYAQQDVRENRKALIFEFIHRYADLIDGLELDFQRQNIVFYPLVTANGHSDPGDAGGLAMTAFVQDIRDELDAVSEAQGRPLYLMVRVPATIRDCRWLGIFVDDWIENELVDVVCPAHIYANSHSVPVDEFLSLAHPPGQPKRALIFPTLLGSGNHYTGVRPFTATPPASGYPKPEVLSWADPESLRNVEPQRGAILNYRAAGVDGFEILNYQMFHPLAPGREQWLQTLLGELGSSTAVLRGRTKVFAVTAFREAGWQDNFGGLNPLPIPNPVDPVVLQRYATVGARSQTVPLNVAEDLSTGPTPAYVGLRIGLRPSRINAATWNTSIAPTDTFTVTLNGVHVLHSGTIGQVGAQGGLLVADYQAGAPVPVHPDDPVVAPVVDPHVAPLDDGGVPAKTAYLQIQIQSPQTQLVNGMNTVTLDFGPNSTIQVVEVNLGLIY